MSQRNSGYKRNGAEAYATKAAWPVVALLSILGPIKRAWDPCAGSGYLVTTLRAQGVVAVGTQQDFLTVTNAPVGVDSLITNPPYGPNKRGEVAMAFIAHALALEVSRVAMLLRVDFDSAIGRQHVFRNCPFFAGKVVLLNRIHWFAGPKCPSDNHSWYLWNRDHVGPPIVHYVTRREAEASMRHSVLIGGERHV